MTWIVHQYSEGHSVLDPKNYSPTRFFGPHDDHMTALRVAGARRRKLGIHCAVHELEPPPANPRSKAGRP